MGLGSKIIAGAGIAGAAAAGITGVRLYRLSRLLQITYRLRVSSLSLKGVTLTIDVVMKNPTAGSLKLKYPFLTVMLGNTLLATSEMQNAWIDIKPYSVTEVNNITFNISTLQELGILASLLVPLTTGQPVTLRAITQTSVRFLFLHFPFTSEEDLVLNNNNGSKNA